ncbi:hypothetical protein PYV02_06805 [Leifsonia sp. H3M29-4]|uniref:DUF3846 domain-containing protein n=1 Tax=Salinibacterium metalliresistens TaxID=3031321 RepID=UPI0023DB8E88|nr:hypothetical protein [Salinibacterium metalliresistens]MDF1478793.1 hypothetical protein [Salinibacterium metalliresistens]
MVLGRDNGKEVGAMVLGIVIPQDGGGDLRLEELAGLRDFQEVTGGWIEPIELDGIDATIYINGEAQRHPGPFNSRATTLHWYHGLHRDRALLLGDAVIVGTQSGERGRVLPWLIHALMDHHEFVVQISPDGRRWADTPLRFASIFEAKLWAMLIDGVLVEGVDVRIEALDACAQHLQKETR